ncbi:MAG: alkyl hydroperoxide reductase, partial [Gemmataceae bacterium]
MMECLIGFVLLMPLAKAPARIDFPLQDLQGTWHTLHQNDMRRTRVFIFLGTECPIANGTLPALNTLAKKLRVEKAPVDLFGVIADRSVTRAAAAKHFAEFRTDFPILWDGSELLQSVLKPTHVPEAFVLTELGTLAYRGAVNNQWQSLGRRRPQADAHYLDDAIGAVLAGKPVALARTKPVGCFIEQAIGDARQLSYHRDVAGILQSRCQTCHRPGQVAPFVLMNYDDAAKRARQIARVIDEQTMPPWIPAPGHKKFVGERWLTDRERQILLEWTAGAKPAGDTANTPPKQTYVAGWHLGPPDLVVKMKEPFHVYASGPDILQNFVLPVEIPTDKLVTAVEFRPG